MSNSYFKRYLWLIGGALIVIIIYLYTRPLPLVKPENQLTAAPKTHAVSLPWPVAGQAALGAAGYGLLAHHGVTGPVPIGSTAKVITALAVLRQKPIQAGSQGPTIALDSSDVDLFNSYYSKGGSVTQVTNGEQITELQALQAMLIPSSNNMADSLAKWAFGSVDSYLTYANQMIQKMGLTKTKVGDTNGFSDTTTSTADDLVKIGLAAMKDPALAGVVSNSTAQIPVAGTIKNINILLGHDGIVGIKTGNTDIAGGCYLFASQRTVHSRTLTVVGAILAQPNLTTALQTTLPLLKASDSGFQPITVVHKNQILGSYKAPWGAMSQFAAAQDLSLLAWKGGDIKITSQPIAIHPSKAGTPVGKITFSNFQQSVSSNLILSNNFAGPSPFWRLLR